MKIYNSNPDQQTQSTVQFRLYTEADQAEHDGEARQQQSQDNQSGTEEYWAGRNLAMRQSARIAA
jgi:hypothetical protein